MSTTTILVQKFKKAAKILCVSAIVGAVPLNIYSSQLAKRCPNNIDTNGGLWEYGPDYVAFCQSNRFSDWEFQPFIAIYNYSYWAKEMTGANRKGIPGYKRGEPMPNMLPLDMYPK